MESRVIQGWRSRLEEERKRLRDDVFEYSGHTLHNNKSLIAGLYIEPEELVTAYKDPNKLARRQKSELLANFSNAERRRKWAEMDPAKKAVIVRQMVINTRNYRKNNPEKYKAWTAEYRLKNRELILIQRKVWRDERSSEKKINNQFVAQIYQQLLALAGLAPWQKKHGE